MTKPLIGYISAYHVLAYFFIYAFLGWIAEVIFATLKTGKFVNRGFLNGPVCPIYGAGMSVCVLLLNPLKDKWWLLFLAGGALATLLEFITGLILQLIFKTKWWDYSKEPFNIKGYVCLKFSLLWGLGILLIFYTLVPLTDRLISAIPFKWWGASLLIVFALTMAADSAASVRQLIKLKENYNEAGRIAKLLRSEANLIGGGVSVATAKLMESAKAVKARISSSRLAKAFPKLKDKPEEVLSEYEKAEKTAREQDEKRNK